ncbi:MAG: hypothetical protein QXE81_02220 [Desulfurococcaceae archaeon]
MQNKITRSSILGFALLVSALSIYLLFYVSSDPLSTLGLVNLARVAGSYKEFCEMISFNGVCKYSLFYVWIISRIPVEFTPILQILVTILIYIAVYTVYRSHIASGLSAFTYILAPTALSAHSLDQTGLFLTTQLIALCSSLIFIGFIKNMDLKFIVPGMILYVLLLFHSLVPIILLTIGILSLVSLLHGSVDRRLVIALGVVLLLFFFSFIYNGMSYYSIISAPAIVLSIGVIILYHVDTRLRMGLAYRSTFSIILLFTALISVITMYYLGVKPVITPIGSNPVALYGLPGLLAVPSVVFTLITPGNIYERYLLAMGFTLLLVSVFELYTITIAIVFLAILSSVFHYNIEDYSKVIIESKSKAFWKGLVIIPLIVFIATSIYASMLIYNKQYLGMNPFNEISSLVSEKSLENPRLDIRAISRQIVEAFKNTASSRSVLLITYWDYSDYIIGVLASNGFKPRVIAHSISDQDDKILLSRIMTSDWRVASQILRNISSEIGVEDVYILVTFAYSSQQNYSFIGVPTEFYLPGENYPTVLFEGFGEFFYNLRYITIANRSISENVNILPIGNLRAISLAWTSTGRETLLNQLCIKALEDHGYTTIYNYMTEMPRLTSIVNGFESIYIENIEIGRVSLTYYGSFDIMYMIALFKLSLQQGE